MDDSPTVDIKLTVRLPLDVIEGLKYSAKAHYRSLNGEIVWGLEQYILYGKKSTNKSELVNSLPTPLPRRRS